MGELQGTIESFPTLKAILWCLYPMTILVTLELLARGIDDDQDAGKMIPIFLGSST